MTRLRPTRLHVWRAGTRLQVKTSAGALTPRVVATAPDRAVVVLVATQALLLGGDEVHLDIRVDAGAAVDLRDIAATVAYDGRGASCRWQADIVLGWSARLCWHGEPFVVADGADCTRDVRAQVARDARLLWRDTLVLGRHGERGGSLRARTQVSVEDTAVLVEDLDLRDPQARNRPGILGVNRVLDQVCTVGWRAPDCPAGPLRLEAESPATLLRRLGPDTHSGPLAEAYSRCATAMFEPGPGAGPVLD